MDQFPLNLSGCSKLFKEIKDFQFNTQFCLITSIDVYRSNLGNLINYLSRFACKHLPP